MNDKTLYLFRGLPGSGKTTAAERISAGIAPVFQSDDFFVNEKGEYNWHKEQHEYAKLICQQIARHYMQHDCLNICVTGTFTTQKEMQPYFDLAKKYGYMVVSLIVENRHGGKNAHDVPERELDRMEGEFEFAIR